MIIYKKRIVLLEFAILIILPLVLLYYFPMLLILRTAAMFVGIIYIYFMIRLYHLNRNILGVNNIKTIISSMKHILPWLILSTVFIGLLYYQNPDFLIIPGVKQNSLAFKLPFSLLLYWLISAPLQEFIFRSYYINRLEQVTKNKLFIILFSSFVFALVHLPFGSWVLTVGSFFLGILLAGHFLKYRDIATLIISHSWIGSIVVILNTTHF